MADFIKLYELWTADGALEVTVHEATDTVFNFDVTRFKYAETYRQMGLGKVGHLMSCNRDGTFCEGYDPDINLKGSKPSWAGIPAARSATAMGRQSPSLQFGVTTTFVWLVQLAIMAQSCGKCIRQ